MNTNDAAAFVAFCEQRHGKAGNRMLEKKWLRLAKTVKRHQSDGSFETYVRSLAPSKVPAVRQMVTDLKDFAVARLELELVGQKGDLRASRTTLREQLLKAEEEGDLESVIEFLAATHEEGASIVREEWAVILRDRARMAARPSKANSSTRIQKSKRKVGINDPAVRHYLEFIVSLTQGIEGNGYSNQSANELYQARDWAQACRIVEVPPEMYVELYQGIDRWTTEVIVQQDFHAPKYRDVHGPDGLTFQETYYEEEEPSEEEALHMITAISGEGRKVPWPDQWPFESTWLSFGPGIWLAPYQIEMRFMSQAARDQRWERGRLVGIMIQRDGKCVEVLKLAKQKAGSWGENEWEEAWQLIPQYQNGRWLEPYGALSPWVTTAISSIIQDHRTVVLEKEKTGMSYQRECQAKRKKMKWPFTPAPFYRIQLRQKLEIEARVRRLFPVSVEIERNHQWDVREHERVRVRRGPLPLDEKTKKDLLRRRPNSGKCYKLYIDRPLEDEDAHRLNLRGFPKFKPAEEWLALLVSPVGEHRKGPADKPYIPGKRVLDSSILVDGLD